MTNDSPQDRAVSVMGRRYAEALRLLFPSESYDDLAQLAKSGHEVGFRIKLGGLLRSILGEPNSGDTHEAVKVVKAVHAMEPDMRAQVEKAATDHLTNGEI